jgi:RND family efflux transporter MFP subunit
MEGVVRAWLAQQCEMIPGVARGIVLLRPAEGGFPVQAARWPESEREASDLAATARSAVVQRQVVVNGANGHGRIAVPLPATPGLSGAVALEIADPSGPQFRAAIERLRSAAAWLGVLARGDAAKDRLRRVTELIGISLEHDSFRAAATAVATELATQLLCDRVCIGFVQRGHMVVEALSHSATFDPRSNLIRDVGLAMDEAADQDATVAHPAPPDAPPRIERAHEHVARSYGTGSIWTVPVARDGRVIGAFSFERGELEGVDAETIQLCEDTAALVGPILELKRSADARLLERWRESIRNQLSHLFGPDHPSLKLAAIASVVLLLVLAFARADYRIAADATLEGRVQRAVVAGIEGYISEAHARAGDLVRKGQILGRLDTRDLVLEQKKLLAYREQLRREYREALAGHDRTQLNIRSAKLAQAEAQLELLGENLSRTQLIAPFDGIVVEGDLSQLLGSPVEKGTVLFEVAPLEGYRIILKVDERRIADVTRGARGELALTALPGHPLPLTVARITPVSVAEAGRNYFRVEASLDQGADSMRPGMEGVAKIRIGRRPLIWIWTHETVDWLRLWAWSFWP